MAIMADYPWALYGIIPLVIFLILLMRKNSVVQEGDPLKRIKHQKRNKIGIFLFRLLIFSCLLIALAMPYSQQEKETASDPKIILLLDNTTSFRVFDETAIGHLQEVLAKELPLEVRTLASGTNSPLGDGLLANIHESDNVLMVTDGYAHEGTALADAAFIASSEIKAKINAVALNPTKKEVAVAIEGPSQTIPLLENIFTVKITKLNADSVQLLVEIDGQVIMDEITSKEEIAIKKTFSSGIHKMTARITSDEDYFPENNVFYKTVHVIPKPKIFVMTNERSPLLVGLSQLYNVESGSALPENLKEYYAVFVDNMPATALESSTDKLSEFVSDGNGLVVVGGPNAYDKGKYEQSVFETILPVHVGTGERKPNEDISIIIAIDISGSTGSTTLRGNRKIDVQKAIAADIINDLHLSDKVGVIAFNKDAYVVTEIAPIRELVDVEDKIYSLTNSGGTSIEIAVTAGSNLLLGAKGSKNIVIISDGKTKSMDKTRQAIADTRKKGVKIFTVGVGEDTNEANMKEIAQLGGGQYFQIDESKNLKILFGGREEQDSAKKRFGITVLNKDHFITGDLSMHGIITGYNQVAPKSTGRMLVTTEEGNPLVSVWRFGLGRVVAVTTDNGNRWGGELYEGDNSRLVARLANWAIGDATKKSDFFVNGEDTTVNTKTTLAIISKQPFSNKDLSVSKIDDTTYEAEVTYDSMGFKDVLGSSIAVNYPTEYKDLGLNPELYDIVRNAEGSMFMPDEAKRMAEEARSYSKKIENAKNYYSWMFVGTAIVLFLLEVLFRKIQSFQAMKEG